ncbi:hypothetical protein O3G_MSEX010643 [Manduca sexta]|uniref:Uncharacterized protein n=1 Tax=Manduca sexta TaxID=7130 RepID=A0A921ZHT1_MANSE|nr:hypothetical protein O3G_MSEX010643 [Manduca sexta]
MMWFKKRESEPKVDKSVENGAVGKLRKKKPTLLKPTRESSERETSTESDKEKRRHSDILDIRVSQERRDESDESLYESADGQSDVISASDDALPRLRTPTISKESLKLAVTDEEVEMKAKKGHRKTMSLSNPLEIVKNLSDEWFEVAKKEHDKNFDKKKSRESLWSEDDRESIHGSTMRLDQVRKDSKKDKNQTLRKTSTTDPPKSRKTSKGSSGALSFLRRRKTPTSSIKPAESVQEDDVKVLSIDEILNYTKLFLEGEKRHSSLNVPKPPVESDTDDEPPTPKQIAEHRRRLSRQTSRSKSKARGKSQSLKVNTLRKSHSGTLKKGKKKSVKTPSAGRSRQASVVEQTPIVKKKSSESMKQNSWLFSSASRGDSRREGSTDEPTAPDADVDTSDANTKEPDKDNNWRAPAGGARGVNRAESCRERDAPRRGKHRNASDPNRLTAHNNHDLEPGAPTAPSGSSSSSSLSSRSNESNTVAAEQQASQSDWSEEDEPLAQQWCDSMPPHVLDSLELTARLRKRQEVIHELIVSEGSHVRWLKVLAGVFLVPLQSQPSLLPPDELRALFPNLPGVREKHAKLYADLRALRSDVEKPIVEIGPVADAMLNTLGDPGYAACLSRFCRGQRMALDALRERRRKNKELHQFLSSREQQPLCERLQLRDLLACVWQRLTKYTLLLEGVAATVVEGEECAGAALERLRRALRVARDVLHCVDTAVRAAENEHRLRTIQSKLEIRVPSGPEWEELRRLELPQHRLRMEGELSIRNESNKKIHVLALMLEDSLVLIQREGDKFMLKPIPQPSSAQHQQLSPLIKWDKVLFRPNAAVRNTFFLMNINGVQMHELSANSASEYAMWVKNIQESPLAKLTELKPNITPSHQPSRSTDDSGINVSRNPSDASEKSTSTAPIEECERDRASVERSSAERERDDKSEPVEEKKDEDRASVDKEEVTERDEGYVARRAVRGWCGAAGVAHGGAGALEGEAALSVAPPAALHAHTAVHAYSHQERLRRLDEMIKICLAAKTNIVAELLGVPKHSYAQVADLAVAESLGYVDVNRELRSSRGRLSRAASIHADPEEEPDLHHLLLAAHTQATQLTTEVRRALSVSEPAAVSARVRRPAPARRDTCDACAHRAHTPAPAPAPTATRLAPPELAESSEVDKSVADSPSEHKWRSLAAALQADPAVEGELSFDMLSDLDVSAPDDLDAASGEDAPDVCVSGAELAVRVSGAASGLQRALSVLLAASAQAPRDALRAELAALRDANDALRARLLAHEHRPADENSLREESVEPPVQDQPSNGG